MRSSRRVRTTVALIGLAAMAWIGAARPAAQDDGSAYRLVDDWPRYPAGAEFKMGTGIAVDAEGTVYAISRDIDHWASHPLAMTRYRGKGSIWKFDRDGDFLGLFAEEQAFIGPHSIYADGDGYLWVVDRDGPWSVVEGALTLSVAAYGNRIYAGTTGAERGRQDVVVVDAETDRVVDRIASANVYVHQMALDVATGDIYVASVYPEHGGRQRGPAGPSFVRWTRDPR